MRVRISESALQKVAAPEKTGRRWRGGCRGAGGQRCLRPALNRCSALTRALCCRTELTCRAAQRPRPGTRVCTCARPRSGRTRTPAVRPGTHACSQTGYTRLQPDRVHTPAARPGTHACSQTGNARTHAGHPGPHSRWPEFRPGTRAVTQLWHPGPRPVEINQSRRPGLPQPSSQPCARIRRLTPVLTANRPRSRAAGFSALCPLYCAAVQPQIHSVSGVCSGPVVPRRSETALQCPASRPAR